MNMHQTTQRLEGGESIKLYNVIDQCLLSLILLPKPKSFRGLQNINLKLGLQNTKYNAKAV